jgi:SpoVK/Ycf46/Vps4 family AAA+-type ATPase
MAAAGAAVVVAGLGLIAFSRRAPPSKNGKLAEHDGSSSSTSSSSSSSSSTSSSSSSAQTAVTFNKYEKELLCDLVDESEQTVDFDDVGGLEDQIKTIEELVIFPLSHPHLYAHSAVAQQPTGMLLYGPPGTGKTLLAKAIAKTASAAFLNVNVAHIQSKWFGETPRLVEAVFTLARKVSPCVVFVDEIDGVLSARNDSDMQHVNTMKTKFMECWDGLTTARAAGASSASASATTGDAASSESNRNWVLVVGATNKPWALDPAVLRRMPRQLYVGLPDARARASILRVLLRKERASPALMDTDLPKVAEAAEGYSGSDLKELVRAAALVPIREEIQIQRAKSKKAGAGGGEVKGKGAPVDKSDGGQARPLVAADLFAALESVKPTGVAANQYRFAQVGSATSFAIKPTNHSTTKGTESINSVEPSEHSNSSSSSLSSSSSTQSSNNVITFGKDVPAYMPSNSMRLNSKILTSALESNKRGQENISAE